MEVRNNLLIFTSNKINNMKTTIELAKLYIKTKNQLNSYVKDGDVTTKTFNEMLEVKQDIHRILLNSARELSTDEWLEIMNLIDENTK